MALDNLVSLKISAPAKIILHGEHSVVYGKTAVAASLNLRTYVALHEENLVDSIRFLSKSVDVDVNFTKESIEALMGTVLDCSWFDPLKINHEKLLDQISVFLECLNLNFNRNQKNSLLAFLYLFVGMTSSRAFPIEAFTIEISSDLTLNSGSGSSASYVVALAATFLQYLRVKNQERYLSDLTAISSNVSKFDITKFLDDEKKIIADWAWLAERIIHGSSSGLDPTICTMGSLIKFRKNETGKHIETLNISNGLRIFLVDTGIPRDIKVLVGKVKSLLQDQPVFVQETFDQMDALALEACDLISSIDSNKFNVFPSEASLQLYQKLSDVIRKNQDCLSDLGVSHRSLNKICEISASYLLPAKLTGAGGGGFAYVLLSPNSNGQDENKLIKELNDAGFKVSNVTICGPGVTID